MRRADFRIRCAALTAATLLCASPARAQIDTLAFGNQDYGIPVVVAVPPCDVVPPCGAVHAAFWAGPKRTLVHAWKTSPGAWQTEAVVDSATVSPDIALNGDGLPSLAFFDSHAHLVYAERSPSGWALDTVATCPGATQVASLAFHTEPTIVYLAGPAGGPTALDLARRSASSWTVIELDSVGVQGVGNFRPSLAFGPQGQPTVAYMKPVGGTGDPDSLVVLEGAGPLGPFTRTVLDVEGLAPPSIVWDTERRRPMVLYGATPDGFSTLEYRIAWRDPQGVWQKQVIGAIPEWPQAGLSLALDPVGNVGALWLDFNYIDQNVGDQLQSCGGFGTGELELSRQPAGVPTAPFTQTQLPHAFHCDLTVGSRGITSGAYGEFGVIWREPRQGGRSNDPHGIFYQESTGGTTSVPPGLVASTSRLALAPNPTAAGAPVRARWSLPRAGEVHLDAHDLAGRRVARLDLGRVGAGVGERAWELPGLSPGVYWVSLVLDGRRTARSVLVRR